jgi:ABC-type oligopeptide transport system substrate-binding subunit
MPVLHRAGPPSTGLTHSRGFLTWFLDDVRSFRTIGRYGLRVTLTRPAPDFLARLTMPFFSAIPTNLPVVAEGVNAPLVSAGP